MDYKKDATPERELLFLEVMMLAYMVHQRTEYCVFIDFSGHVDSLSIGIRKDVKDYQTKVCETEIYNNYKKYSGSNDEQDGYLKSVRDTLREILKSSEVPVDQMEQHVEKTYYYTF